MKSQLRTPKQGADCIIWAAVCPLESLPKSGSFLEDRKAVAKHLRFASTWYTEQEVGELVGYLNDASSKFEQDASVNAPSYDDGNVGYFGGDSFEGEDYHGKNNETGPSDNAANAAPSGNATVVGGAGRPASEPVGQ